MKKNRNSVQFTYKRTLKIRFPEFKLSKNIQYLDRRKLSKGSHIIELGKFESCGCDCTVSAKIKNGMITGIKYPRCKNARPIPAKAAAKMRAAHGRLTKNAQREWEDIPVHDLDNNTVVARMTDIIVSGDCFMVCWDEGLGEECVICCFEAKRHWCIGPSEPALQL